MFFAAKNRLDSQFPLLYGNKFSLDFLSKKLKNKIAIRPVGAGCEFFSVPTPGARASFDFDVVIFLCCTCLRMEIIARFFV